MPSKSFTSSKTTSKATGARSRKTSSKKVNPAVLQSRRSFLAGAVLISSALVAIAMGIGSHDNTASIVSGVQPVDGTGSLYLRSADNSNAKVGSTIYVDLYENSGKEPVNTVQSAIQYPADKLEFVAVNTANSFPQEAATDTTTPGLLRIARSVIAGGAPVTGAKPVATIEFKLLQEPKAVSLGIDMASSLLVRSTDNQNILQ